MPSDGGGSARSVAVARSTHHRLRIPLARPQHPQRCPIVQRGWHVRVESLERAFPWVADQGHQHPTAEQKVLRLGAVKVSLERIEHLIYLTRDTCATPHVSRSCLF